MGLKIKQHEKKWRIEVQEEWEFETLKDMKETLDSLVSMKSKYGNLKR